MSNIERAMEKALAEPRELQVRPISNSFTEMMELAKTLLGSGFLPRSIRTPAQAVAIILKGREVGIPEMEALQSIHVIEGKPTLSAELMLALCKRRVGMTAHVMESTDLRCQIKFSRPDNEPHIETFTMDDAVKLGFAKKDNYGKQAATMLRWRCVSKGCRFYAPDALSGISYTPDELGATVNDHGEYIDVEVKHDVPLVGPGSGNSFVGLPTDVVSKE